MPQRRILIPGILVAGAVTAAAAVWTWTETRPMPVLALSESLPFNVETIADFRAPWAIGVLPDSRLLVTEQDGKLFLVTPEGEKTEVANVPRVQSEGQLGLHDVAPAPDFAQSGQIYFTYIAPGDRMSHVVLARATLTDAPALEDVTEIWRQEDGAGGGHPGAVFTFDPEGTHIFLTTGDRQVNDGAPQDPDIARGKVIRLALDGSVPADNPQAGEEGVRAQTWTQGHRNPYGIAFAPDGLLWLHEMGPRDGDELNLLAPGLDYGWPTVSNGMEYSGEPIPNHDTRPEFEAPVITWTPVISPAGMVFYEGPLFSDWQGSALIGGLSSESLVRVTVEGETAQEAERFAMGTRIRDVAVTPDGAIWLIEDAARGRLLRLTPGQ
ncbi:MAG: PQQ-dependent sugar dehydrogenase [Pararhodobacter sp.]